MSEVVVVGGGPAGLMAADVLSAAGVRVTIFDRMPSLGRKLLIAGRGGLNLTHSEDLERFLDRYGAARGRLEPLIRAFPPEALRAFAAELGQDTFVGTSGRVFPKAMKASPLLRAWLRRLAGRGVAVRLRHRLVEGEGRQLVFEGPDGGRVEVQADAVVLAVGGASWPRLGSDGGWAAWLQAKGVAVTPLTPANCGVRIAWSPHLLARAEGRPLKRIALAVGAATVRGEAVITRTGLEGGAVYAMTPAIRAALRDGPATLAVDLLPDLAPDDLVRRLSRPRAKQSAATWLRKVTGLAPGAIALLHEGGGRALPAEPAALAALIKAVPLAATGLAGLERAISTAGGVALAGLDDHLMLEACPGWFVAGEMLDWEAPTGGYLLQACFSTAVMAARHLASELKKG